MSHETLVLAPTSEPTVFVAPDGARRSAPLGWACLPPGDAGLTRRVKELGPSWAIIEKKGRKAFSNGLWAPRENIERARADDDAAPKRKRGGYRAVDKPRRALAPPICDRCPRVPNLQGADEARRHGH
ncbi:hypothetical protein WME79_12435 [Sorangium sp. So ce726]|uniref:hypothetical protein n=1 Tax=Sorangium sp. So ce726 TaxID=3133319 RepID=UPI003F5F3041